VPDEGRRGTSLEPVRGDQIDDTRQAEPPAECSGCTGDLTDGSRSSCASIGKPRPATTSRSPKKLVRPLTRWQLAAVPTNQPGYYEAIGDAIAAERTRRQ